jgi:hypothetical protein
VALQQVLALATDLRHAEQQVLGGGVLVAEAPSLLLGPVDDALCARVEGQRATLDAGALGQDAGDLVAERRQVRAEPPERLRGNAVIGLEQRREHVLGIDDRALEPLGELLGGDDGLLGLFGEAVELHGGRFLWGCQARGSG